MGASFLEEFSNNDNQELVLKDQFALVGGQNLVRSINKKQLNKDHKEQIISAMDCLNSRAKNNTILVIFKFLIGLKMVMFLSE